MEKQKITEEMGVHKAWKDEAKKQTVETLPEFIRHLTEDFEHDYGTIVHAMTSGMIASVSAIDHSPQGGMTGFQASCLMWPIIKEYGGIHGKSGARILNYDDILYPQKEDVFTKISQTCWDSIQFQAQELLKDEDIAVERVREHWQSIVNGKIPFGLSLEEADTPPN